MICHTCARLRQQLRSLINSKRTHSTTFHYRSLRAEGLEARRLFAIDYLASDASYNVIDINSGGAPLYKDPAIYGTDMYYLDSDSTYGAELHRLDTTTGEVSIVADINPGIADSYAGLYSGFAMVGSKLYFSATDSEYGTELRWIDLAEPTPVVQTLNIFQFIVSSDAGSISGLVPVGDKLYFTGLKDIGAAPMALYWIDTTLDTPQVNRVAFNFQYPPYLPDHSTDVDYVAVGNKLYFNTTDDQYGNELRWIDTVDKPNEVNTIDLTTGPSSTWTSANFKPFKVIADKLFLQVPADGPDSWRAIDTSSPIQQVTYYGNYGGLATSGDQFFFFRPYRTTSGGTLWTYDVTLGQIREVEVTSDFVLPSAGDYGGYVMVGNKMYFSSNGDLYWIDTTLAAPKANLQLLPAGNSSVPKDSTFEYTAAGVGFYGGFEAAGDRLYFSGYDSGVGMELRWIDTTLEVPLVNTININTNTDADRSGNSNPGQYGGYTLVGDRLFFTAKTVGPDPGSLAVSPKAIGGYDLFWVDTTKAETEANRIELSASASGSLASQPGDYVLVNNKLFFNSEDSETGMRTRWIDTTLTNPPVHTLENMPAKRLDSLGVFVGYDGKFGVVGSKVYFGGDDGRLRWVDTLEEGMPLHVISSLATEAGRYGGFASAGNKLFYFAGSSTFNSLYWLDTTLPDPTPQTYFVRGAMDDLFGNSLNFLQVVGDKLYFGSSESLSGLNWIDTTSVLPIVHQVSGNRVQRLSQPTLVGDVLFYTEGPYSSSLHWLDTSDPSGQINDIRIFDPGSLFGFKSVGSKLYFDAVDTTSNTRMLFWIDTSLSTFTLNKVAGNYNLSNNETWGSFPQKQFQVAGDKLFFDASESSNLAMRNLRWIDTSASDPSVHTVYLEPNSGSKAIVVAAVGNKVYFRASDYHFGDELRWIDANDPSETVHTIDIDYGRSRASTISLKSIVVDDKLYFTTDNRGRGQELIALDILNAPGAISISESTFNENVALGSELATLTSRDADAAETFTYALVSGPGDGDNALFSITGDKLVLNAALDFESKEAYSIRLRSTDSTNRSFERTFIISVLDVAEGPILRDDNYDIPVNYLAIISEIEDGVLGNDTDGAGAPVTIATLVTPPAHGTLTFNADGTFRYRPGIGASVGQTETFTYEVTDAVGTSTATVTLTIAAAISSPFNNPTTPTDVISGASPGVTSSLDALAVVNFLNANRGRISIPVEEITSTPTSPRYDVNNDFVVSPLDLLAIFNFINARIRGGEGEASQAQNYSVRSGTNRENASLIDAAIVDLTDLPNKKRG